MSDTCHCHDNYVKDVLIPQVGVITDIREETPDVKTFRVNAPEGGKLFEELGEDQEIEGLRAIHDTETPIDPERPDLGPISNQMLRLGSRADGRAVMGSRFATAYGTINNVGHGST